MEDEQVVDHYALGIKNTGRIKAVEDRLDRVECRLDGMAEDIQDIKEKLLSRLHPMWVFVITASCSIAASAVTWLITLMQNTTIVP